jgi:hypothetical protein
VLARAEAQRIACGHHFGRGDATAALQALPGELQAVRDAGAALHDRDAADRGRRDRRPASPTARRCCTADATARWGSTEPFMQRSPG